MRILREKSSLVFALSSMLNGLSALVVIPLVIGLEGAQDWAGLAVGHAAGTLLSVFVANGWGVSGPGEARATSEASRPIYYTQSFVYRSVLLLLLAPLGVGVSLAVAPPGTSAIPGAIACATVLVSATGGSWFFMGINRPTQLIRYDTLPRFFGTILGAFLLVLGGGVTSLVLTQLVAAVLASLWTLRRLGAGFQSSSLAGMGATLRRFVPSLGVGIVVSASSALPVLTLSALAAGSVATFSVVDKGVRFLLMSLLPVAMVMQGWIAAGDSREERVSRLKLGMRRSAMLAGVLGIGFGLLLATVGPLIAAEDLQIDRKLGFFSGAWLGMLILNASGTYGVLNGLGLQRYQLGALTSGLAVGLIAAATLAIDGGPSGAVLGLALGELVVAAAVAIAVLRYTSQSSGG